MGEAKRYTSETDELAILAELQHYGGATNLIDFTTDYLIALFFACDGDPEENGRIILLKSNYGPSSVLFKPSEPVRRVIAQKSVFVRPRHGFIEDEYVEKLVIPSNLKEKVLNHLRRGHGISSETIYNDLHGYIRQKKIHQLAKNKFYEGLALQDSKDYESAIKSNTESIRLNSQHSETFNNRGTGYFYAGEFVSAKADFDNAISRDPGNVIALFNRGITTAITSLWKESMSDLNAACALGLDVGDQFRSNYISIEEFEKKYKVTLPPCFVEILGER